MVEQAARSAATAMTAAASFAVPMATIAIAERFMAEVPAAMMVPVSVMVPVEMSVSHVSLSDAV
jgi:hypothetical protein